MAAVEQPIEALRLLLVSANPGWQLVAQQAAAALGADLDVCADCRSAMMCLLRNPGQFSHVLAPATLPPRMVDAFASLLDECDTPRGGVILLGCERFAGPLFIACVREPDPDALVAALAAARPPGPPSMLGPSDLDAAFYAGAVRMRFQPILRASDLQPIGLEALVRLHDPVLGIVHPADFVPACATYGRDGTLTALAIEAACRDIELDISDVQNTLELSVGINIPVSVALDRTAPQRAASLCAAYGMAPGLAVLEILESRTKPDLKALRNALTSWRQEGFRVAIDDAGPDLPHWRDLIDLPIDIVKLDGALLRNEDGDATAAAIVEAARGRGRFIVAEGIDSTHALDRVRALGVDAVQGFMFSHPLPSLALPVWLSWWREQLEINRVAPWPALQPHAV